MVFANPVFLYALGFLAIPIAIHLFNFRKFKRINFTNVALLSELKEQTQSTSRLKNLLLLITRILLITCLVLAFAEPFVPGPLNVNSNIKTVGLYIDNSPSMGNNGEEGILLQEAIAKGKSVLSAFPENTSFILCTSNSSIDLQRELTKTEAIDKIELIKPSNSSLSSYAACKKIKAVASDKPVSIFLISDFQQSGNRLSELKEDTTLIATLVPVSTNNNNNLSIDSIWFSSPTHQYNAQEELNFSVHNFGDEKIDNVSLKLTINNQSVGVATVSIDPDKSITGTIKYTNKYNGFVDGVISLDDSPIIFDNTYNFAYQVKTKLNIALLNDSKSSDAINQLFKNDPEYALTRYTLQDVDYKALKKADCLIIDGLENINSGLQEIILSKLNNGQSVAIFPGGKINLDSYNQLFRSIGAQQFANSDTTLTPVKSINTKHSFFTNIFDKVPANMDLPYSKLGYTTLNSSRSNTQVLLGLQSGSSFLSTTSYKSGQLFVFNTPLKPESSNLIYHGLFAPIILRIAETGGYIQQSTYVIGQEKPITLQTTKDTKEGVYKLNLLGNESISYLPLSKQVNNSTLLYPPKENIEPGIYTIKTSENDTISHIGINLSSIESDLKMYSTDQLKELTSDKRFKLLQGAPEKIYADVLNQSQNQKIWKWFILAAFVFLVIEILIAKWLNK